MARIHTIRAAVPIICWKYGVLKAVNVLTSFTHPNIVPKLTLKDDIWKTVSAVHTMKVTGVQNHTFLLVLTCIYSHPLWLLVSGDTSILNEQIILWLSNGWESKQMKRIRMVTTSLLYPCFQCGEVWIPCFGMLSHDTTYNMASHFNI